jgi:hypothetical protein
MINELDPVVGNWYRHLDKGQYFTVVAVSDEEETVEIQHFDGDVEELDFAAWQAQDIELAEAPEDSTGPMDDVEVDDLDYSETAMTAADWSQPLAEGPADDETSKLAAAAEEEDEPDEGVMAEELRDPRDVDEQGGAP